MEQRPLTTAPMHVRRGLSGLLVACAASMWPAACTAPRQAGTMDSALRGELIQLGQEDQTAREGFGPALARNDTAYVLGLLRGDSARTRRLREIVTARGWPTPQLVGKEGVNGAWLILQHTPDTAFRRRLLPTLDSAQKRGDIPANDYVTMLDRILVESGKPQIYGTQFAFVNGRLVAQPIEDTARVDERRAAVGLPPMAEYVALLKDGYKMPVDWQPRR